MFKKNIFLSWKQKYKCSKSPEGNKVQNPWNWCCLYMYLYRNGCCCGLTSIISRAPPAAQQHNSCLVPKRKKNWTAALDLLISLFNVHLSFSFLMCVAIQNYKKNKYRIEHVSAPCVYIFYKYEYRVTLIHSK
jgi:hypothetical protein